MHEYQLFLKYRGENICAIAVALTSDGVLPNGSSRTIVNIIARRAARHNCRQQ